MKFRKLVSAAIILFISSSAQVVHAEDFYWACGNGNWDSGSCWSGTQAGAGGFGVPNVFDDAYIYNTSSNDVAVTYNSNLYPINRLPSYVLDANNTGNLSLTLEGEQILRSNYGTVGDIGAASVIQNSGDNYTYFLDLGKSQTGNGTYYLNGGNLITNDTRLASSMYGASGTGTFIQSGGNHQTGSLHVGKSSFGIGSSTATYELNAGTLSTRYSYVMSGNGVFNQSGGIHNAQQYVRTNYDSNGGAGTYNLSGGTLNTMTLLNVGGVFNYTGGELNLSSGIRNSGTFILNKGEGETHEFEGYVSNTGVFEVAAGETAVFKGLVIRQGSFTGDGTKVFQGEYRPGNVNLPPEPIPDDPLPDQPVSYYLANGASFAGNAIFEETSMISLFLLGDGQSDWLNFSGPVDLSGTLNLSLGLDEYMPMLGDSWDIIFGNDIGGEFSNIISDAPNDWGWEILYLDDRVTLTSVSSVPVPAAVWLFGSGLIGLIGFARRKKA